MIRYPEIRLLLDLTDWPGNLIEAGADVAICRGPLPESNLVARQLLKVDTCLLGSPAYLEAQGGAPATPADLVNYDLITPAVVTDDVYHCTLHGPNGELTLTLTPRLGSHNLMLRYQAALAGLGLTWLPLVLCASDLQAGRLQRVLPDWSESPFSLYVVYPHRRGLVPKVRVFIDFLVEQLEALSAIITNLPTT
jgi:DNA-binding transcriptional LysR family regulator